ncbi:OprD family outer membrane porin [Malaciobacter sp. WC5094]
MKKITKLSMAACLLFSGTTFADTLEEAFSNSKMKGEIKAQYFSVEPVSDGKSDDISVIGGNINVITGSFYGFNAGVTFQTSHVLDISTEGTNDFNKTMDASGSVMSEAYLQYTISNTSLKVGRQYIKTPLVAGSGTRMIKQSFEGITVVNKDLPNTIVSAAYVDKYQDRTNQAGDPGEFDQFEDGAMTLYIKNNSIENLTLQAQYLDVKGKVSANDKDATYLEAGYDFGVANIHAQYFDTTNGSEDGTMFGLKASGNVGMFNLTALYTTTGSDGTVYPGVGSGADNAFTALPLHGGSVTYTKNTDTLVGVIATNIAGVTAVAYYGQVNTDEPTSPLNYEKIDAVGGFLQYAFNKNLSAKVMYESADFDTASNDDNIFRVYTSYKF